jgi:RNA polymerase sigma-70 factor, ECF subfamily
MDRSLNAQLAADLDGSFESVVREHQDRLYSLALRSIGNAHDAEELTQDAFVRAYRALRGYEPLRILELELRGWLTTILLNLCRNHRSRRTTVAFSLDPETIVQDPSRDRPDASYERREAASRWAALVTQLPLRYRDAVLLRHLDGWSYPEMASILGRPEGTVKAQVHRGVDLLRAAYEAAERGSQRPGLEDQPARIDRSTANRAAGARAPTAPSLRPSAAHLMIAPEETLS